MFDAWFVVPVQPAISIKEYEMHMPTYIRQGLEECSPNWGLPLFYSVPIRNGPPRPQSAAAYVTAAQAVEHTMVRVRLFMDWAPHQVIDVPDNMISPDLRRRASQEFAGRVLTVPDGFPLKDGTVVKPPKTKPKGNQQCRS
jgi:hypothetical protein